MGKMTSNDFEEMKKIYQKKYKIQEKTTEKEKRKELKLDSLTHNPEVEKQFCKGHTLSNTL
jgi:hypothetical protein